MTAWRYPFDETGLNYLSSKANRINDIAAILGVPAPGLAGGIAREITMERYVYPRDRVRQMAQNGKEFLTSWAPDESGPPLGTDGGFVPWTPITHARLARYFAGSNTLGRDSLENPSYYNRFKYPVLLDVGPGNIKIRTAINMLQNYNQLFPDSDPLDLKRYNDRYDLLVRDLKSPDSDTTVKIAGLVAREGQDFFTKAMTPQRWGALNDDQRAAALTKYYAVGKERMEDDFVKQGGNPGTYTPDFNGDGSDMYLYDPGNGSWSNPALLKNALSPAMRTQNSPGQPAGSADAGPSASGGGQRQAAAQSLPGPSQPQPAGLPPQVVGNANYLIANGFAITPRTMYVAHVIGPQRAVDLFRTGATGSPDVPSPDAATGDQVRGWVRALRAAELMPAAGAIAAPPPGGSPETAM